jgi:Rieske Fe-S protein
MTPPEPTPRRRFLQTTAIAAAAVACQGCAALQRRDLAARAPDDATELVLILADHPDLATPNGFIRAKARGDRILVVRMPEGDLRAWSMTCTHWGCDVDWQATRTELHCSCHGSRFAVDGGVLEGPADEPLPTYRVTEADGTATVHLV